ncbi:MAG TPA: ATP phosphoribosyltransferase [Candidatus Dormibacteraeota bacterium]
MTVTIALPTGNIQGPGLALLARADLIKVTPQQLGRRLLVESGGLRLVVVRPADVPAYVEHGAADLGIVGKDQLWEAGRGQGLYELLDLRTNACRLVIAVPEKSPLQGPESWPPTLRVATKYVRATSAYMESLGQAVDLVRLHGSVELAPQVGLVDAISDLTETGNTLRENRLRIVAVIGESTTRLIANQVSLKTRAGEVQDIVRRLRGAVESAD